MKVKKIEFNKSSIIALLQSQEMMSGVLGIAQKKGTVETSFVGFDRVQVIVKEEGDVNRTDGA